MTERTPITIDDSPKCQDCPLALRPYVPGVGVSPCSLMVIGCAPSTTEERSGLPFEGKTGQMIREILTGIGYADRTYFTNVMKRRPVSEGVQRAPSKREAYICSGHLAVEIEKLKPALIVTLGATALRTVTGKEHDLHQVHGLALPVTRYGMRLMVLPLYDPGYVMRRGGLMSNTGQLWITDMQSIPEHLERAG